jgi:hypothetical protein
VGLPELRTRVDDDCFAAPCNCLLPLVRDADDDFTLLTRGP